MGKRLSDLFDSTLKEAAEESCLSKRSKAVLTIASLSLMQAAALVRLIIPKTLLKASKAPSMSQFSFWGWAYMVD
jgi:hypothetical protein